ncbi:MAG: SH3 domain-containing protein [Aggregatilineales bacterium]
MRPALFLTLALLASAVSSAQANTVTVVADQTVNVRSGPGAQFEIVARLEAGDSAVADGRDSADSLWLRVVLADNLRGWVATFTVTVEGDAQALSIVSADTDPIPLANAEGNGVRVIAVGRVNVRSGPAITYDVLGQLEAGDEAQAQARSSETNDWLLIEGAELSGWVAFFTVTVLGDPDTLPLGVPEIGGDGLIPPSALVQTRYNTRLRAAPSFLAPVLEVIPFGATVQPLARSSDGRWLYLAYDSLRGWSLTSLLDVAAESVENLPLASLIQQPAAAIPTPAPAAGS